MKDNIMDDINTESIQKDNLLTENDNTSTSDNLLKNLNVENKTLEIEIKPKEIKLEGEGVEEIFEKIEKNEEMKVYKSYRIKKSQNIISLENDNNNFEVHYLFKKELIINYKNVKVSNEIITLIDKSVKSSNQIEKTMEKYNIKSLNYEAKPYRNFPNFKNSLFELVNSNNFTINFLSVMEELKYKLDKECIENIPQIIDLNSLSTYANKYLAYAENRIEYIQTEERNKFLSFLNDFIFIEDVNFFKITGPSNDGKTVTLLLFHRTRNNIIYFNLKYIMELFYSNNNNYLKVMMYELGRAILSSKEKTEIEKIFKGNTIVHPWKIILQITEVLKNDTKIIILDQIKEKTIDFRIYNKIEEDFLGKQKLKFIVCSSINDTFIRYKILDTIKNNRGNPEYLHSKYQKYYFYFCNLLSKEKLKEYYGKKYETNKFINHLKPLNSFLERGGAPSFDCF